MLFAMVAQPQVPEPVFSIDLRGKVHGGEGMTLRPGTCIETFMAGRGCTFTGGRSGFAIEDRKELRLTKSMGISCWVKLDRLPDNANGSQIVFRGDDRNGHDPYTLVVHSDGSVNFGIADAQNVTTLVKSRPIQLNRWTHIVASLSDLNGGMRIWVDGVLEDARTTELRPYADLDPGTAPGVGIGNVQNEFGPHNQPLYGSLADVRIYDVAINPKTVGYNPEGWPVPYRE